MGIEVVGDGLDDSVVEPVGPWRGIAALARLLESFGVDYWVIGAERGEPADPERVSLDATLIATVAARHSSTLGLVVAAAAHRDHPYNLARRLLSVDHAAHGRVGWLALDFDHALALNAAIDTWTGAELEFAHTTDAVDAVRTLWRTWPLESLIGDRRTGVFADTTQIKRADVARGYAITGPLNVPGSAQGDLPIWRHATPGAEQSASGADLVIVEDGTPLPVGGPGVVVRLRPGDVGAHTLATRTSARRIRHGDGLDTALERLAVTPGVVGVLVRLELDSVTDVLGDALPEARRRGLVADRREKTLRGQLRLPVPVAPDLSAHALAFAGVPNPGARL